MKISTAKRLGPVILLLSCAVSLLSTPSFVQGEDPFFLRVYALRGPRDSSAKLYLAVSSAGAARPQQFDAVRVSVRSPTNELTFVRAEFRPG